MHGAEISHGCNVAKKRKFLHSLLQVGVYIFKSTFKYLNNDKLKSLANLQGKGILKTHYLLGRNRDGGDQMDDDDI